MSKGQNTLISYVFATTIIPYLTRIKPANLNEFMNIQISIYMINTIYSTNLIG